MTTLNGKSLNTHTTSIDGLYVRGINLQCNECATTFYLQKDYINHMVVVHNNHKPYSCNQCQSTFSTKHRLRGHIARVHGGKTNYQCEDCGKRFNRKRNWKRHCRIHTGEKPFVCDHCSRAFNVKDNLKRHVRRLHSNHTNAQCESKQYIDAKSLVNNLYVAGINLECADCRTVFYFHKDYINHMFIYHGIDHPYQCQQCDRKFIGKTKLLKHIERKHTKNKEEGITKHPCNQCKGSFESKSLLLAHRKTAHSELSLECSRCFNIFKRRSSLKAHVRRIHDKEINYRCKSCGKGFFHKTQWTIHCRIHSGEKPYVCGYENCSKKFTSKGNLNRHTKSVHSKRVDVKQTKRSHRSTKLIHSKQQKCNLGHDSATGHREGETSETEKRNDSNADEDLNVCNEQPPIPKNQCPSCTASFDRKWKLKLHLGLCSFIQERKRNFSQKEMGRR